MTYFCRLLVTSVVETSIYSTLPFRHTGSRCKLQCADIVVISFLFFRWWEREGGVERLRWFGEEIIIKSWEYFQTNVFPIFIEKKNLLYWL